MTTPVDEVALAAAAEAAQAAHEANMSKYVAAGTITIAGARAFNEGDPVPASHVESGVVDLSQVTEVAQSAEPAPEQPATAADEVPTVPAVAEEV